MRYGYPAVSRRRSCDHARTAEAMLKMNSILRMWKRQGCRVCQTAVVLHEKTDEPCHGM